MPIPLSSYFIPVKNLRPKAQSPMCLGLPTVQQHGDVFILSRERYAEVGSWEAGSLPSSLLTLQIPCSQGFPLQTVLQERLPLSFSLAFSHPTAVRGTSRCCTQMDEKQAIVDSMVVAVAAAKAVALTGRRATSKKYMADGCRDWITQRYRHWRAATCSNVWLMPLNCKKNNV